MRSFCCDFVELGGKKLPKTLDRVLVKFLVVIDFNFDFIAKNFRDFRNSNKLFFGWVPGLKQLAINFILKYVIEVNLYFMIGESISSFGSYLV